MGASFRSIQSGHLQLAAVSNDNLLVGFARLGTHGLDFLHYIHAFHY